MNHEAPRLTSAVRDGLGGYLQISARGRHLLRSLRFASPALIHVQHGEKRLRHAGQHASFASGTWFAVPAGMQLDVENVPTTDSTPYRALCIEFAPTLLRPQADARLALRPWYPLHADAALTQAVEHLRDGLAEPSLPDRVLQHRFAEVWLALTEQGFSAGIPRQPTAAERVRELLMHSPSTHWRSRIVATGLAISEATLRRRLAAEGTSLRQIAIDLRLGAALAQLQSTSRPIQRIADDAGYQSASRFTAAFRRRYGLTPSAIRGNDAR
ncbi:helix-turn-helix transcriptional regulator [Solimonas marina]|uniref:Helix-turn-helix transcriptional regulator n=1 Tax=Solimonas marina TaxID=2714601 RepID=A0A969W5L7_9GAMM|nr:helix-turn-helix transcriptional regulator [Solimonas marina]NKF21101.1 helix-turn-helix transcriptional regulator [Solimonas marina]